LHGLGIVACDLYDDREGTHIKVYTDVETVLCVEKRQGIINWLIVIHGGREEEAETEEEERGISEEETKELKGGK
jgi:hypothetical protein